jgi:hypothetical protein
VPQRLPLRLECVDAFGRSRLGEIQLKNFGFAALLYVATHPAQTLVRIDPSGKRTTIAGPDQGMVGATACAFGTAPGDEHALYVSTDGGFVAPHEGAVQDAKLVRLELGESGHPLLGQR